MCVGHTSRRYMHVTDMSRLGDYYGRKISAAKNSQKQVRSQDASECDRTPVSAILRKRGSGLLATARQ